MSCLTASGYVMSDDFGCACVSMMVPHEFVTPWMTSKGSELSCHPQKALPLQWRWRAREMAVEELLCTILSCL